MFCPDVPEPAFSPAHTYTTLPIKNDRMEIRAWRCYDFAIGTTTFDGSDFDYLYVPRSSATHAPASLSPEPFNHELLKVNTSSEKDVINFAKKYGIPFSPLYDSKERFLTGHYRSKSHPYPRGSLLSTEAFLRNAGVDPTLEGLNPTGFFNDHPESDDPHMYVRGALFRVELLPFIDMRWHHGNDGPLFGCYASEIARQNCYSQDPDGKIYGGIISVPEMQSTLRLFQCLFPLLTVGAFSKNDNITASQIVAYLTDKKYVNQNGPMYFAHDEFHSEEFNPTRASLESMADSLVEIGQSTTRDEALASATIILNAQVSQRLSNAIESAEYFFDLSARKVLDSSRDIFIRDALRKDASLKALISSLHPDTREKKVSENGEAGSLTELLYAQYSFELAMSAPWIRCGNCGRIFKLGRESNLITSKTIRPAMYCKRSCSVAASTKAKPD